jgi:hypothetical protein
MRRIENGLRSTIVSTREWETQRSAAIAARLFAPFGCTLSLRETVALKRKFASIFDVAMSTHPADDDGGDSSAGVGTELVAKLYEDIIRLERDTGCNNQDLSTLDALLRLKQQFHTLTGSWPASTTLSPEAVTIQSELLSYQMRLDGLLLNDERIRRELRSLPVLAYQIGLRGMQACALGVCAIPGLLLSWPIILGGRLAERRMHRKYGHLDEPPAPPMTAACMVRYSHWL